MYKTKYVRNEPNRFRNGFCLYLCIRTYLLVVACECSYSHVFAFICLRIFDCILHGHTYVRIRLYSLVFACNYLYHLCTYSFLPVQTCHPKTNTSNNQEKIHVDHKLGSTTANDVSREEKPSTVNRQPIRNHQPSTLKIIYMKRFQNQANTYVSILKPF